MEERFWLERWEANRIAFHEGQANGLLVKHCERLARAEGRRVLLPLCGKTRVGEHYGGHYTLTQLAREEIPGGLKRTRPVWEVAWLLERK